MPVQLPVLKTEKLRKSRRAQIAEGAPLA